MGRITRQENQELTRQRLREAARAEFAQHGIAGSSIDRITEAAGFSRGAFYSNYASKNELALDLMSGLNSAAIAASEKLIRSNADPLVLMRKLERLFDRQLKPVDSGLLSVELRLAAARSEEFRQLYAQAEADVMAQLLSMIRSLCRALDLEASAGVDYVAFAINAFTHGFQVERSNVIARRARPGRLLVRLIYDLLGRPAQLRPLFA